MKWKPSQFDFYLKSKEYVDTAVIPLVPFQWGKAEKETMVLGEFTQYMSESIEKQFTGRVFLMPAFTYLKSEQIDDRLNRLKTWDAQLFKHGFNYMTFITSDVDWKSVETQLPDELIWLPALSSEGIDSNQYKQTIEQQVSQVMPLFSAKWQRDPYIRDM